MVRDDGYVKVVDFGIARLIRMGDGRHPFERESAIEVLTAICEHEATTPSRINLELPPALDALILEMLQKDAARRPTAAEIASRLSKPVSPTRVPAAPRPAADHERVGRLREREELRSAFNAVTGGHGVLVGVAGETGIGKTTLVEAAVKEFAEGPVPCFIAHGRCSERLAGAEAYLPFLEAFDNLLRAEGRESVARILKAVAPAWYSQLTRGSQSRWGCLTRPA